MRFIYLIHKMELSRSKVIPFILFEFFFLVFRRFYVYVSSLKSFVIKKSLSSNCKRLLLIIESYFVLFHLTPGRSIIIHIHTSKNSIQLRQKRFPPTSQQREHINQALNINHLRVNGADFPLCHLKDALGWRTEE